MRLLALLLVSVLVLLALGPACVHGQAVDISSTSTNGTTSIHSDILSKFDSQHIPWLLTLPPKKIKYIGLQNDLKRLVNQQHTSRWVTVFMFNKGVQRWALNCIYSYIKFGRVGCMHGPCATQEAAWNSPHPMHHTGAKLHCSGHR
jgi:hypothetical protein